MVVCVCNPSVGNADTDRSLGLWPASRAVSASSRPRYQTLSQKTRWMVLSNDSKGAFLTFTLLCTHAAVYIQNMHTCIGREIIAMTLRILSYLICYNLLQISAFFLWDTCFFSSAGGHRLSFLWMFLTIPCLWQPPLGSGKEGNPRLLLCISVPRLGTGCSSK